MRGREKERDTCRDGFGGREGIASGRERNRVDECQSLYYLNVCNELYVHIYIIAVNMHVHVHLPSNEF